MLSLNPSHGNCSAHLIVVDFAAVEQTHEGYVEEDVESLDGGDVAGEKAAADDASLLAIDEIESIPGSILSVRVRPPLRCTCGLCPVYP